MSYTSKQKWEESMDDDFRNGVIIAIITLAAMAIITVASVLA